MSKQYKPCRDCGRQKEGDRRSTLYCGPCYEARYEARVKAASLCGNCSDRGEYFILDFANERFNPFRPIHRPPPAVHRPRLVTPARCCVA